MALIVWLQALEPHALWHFVFALLSWYGDGPLYFLLFPLLYWRKAPAVAIRYGYVVGLAVLLLTVMKAQTTTPRPFLKLRKLLPRQFSKSTHCRQGKVACLKTIPPPRLL